MKHLSMAFSRIGYYLRRQRLFFSVYLIGSVACILTFAYFLGNGVTYKVNEARNDVSYRTYRLIFEHPQTIEPDVLDELRADIETIRLESTVTKAEISASQSNELTINYDEYYVHAYYPILPQISLKRGKTEALDTGTIIIPSDFVKSGHNISQLTIGTMKYSISGESANYTEFIISADDFISGWSADQIQLLSKKVLSQNDRQSLIKKLNKLYPEATVEDPGDSIKEGLDNSATNIAYLSLLFLICLSTFSLLMQYMIEQNAREIVTYSIVGASPLRIAGLLMLDNLLISGISVCIAIILHKALYNSVFSLLNIYEGISYTFADYALLTILVIILSEISMIPMTYKLLRRSAVQNMIDIR